MGASGQMAAPLGRYVGVTGAMNATPAELGRYVNVTGASAATAADIGHYVNNTGASAQSAANYGSFVSTTGASVAQLAAPGYYVNTTGASAQIAANIGSYVAVAGASIAQLAAVGYYVNTTAASVQTAANYGSYVSTAGASIAQLAAVGYYVNTTAASAQTAANYGSYVSVVGASVAQLAGPGYYVNTTGASAQIAASIGSYVSTAGASVAQLAAAGYYVNTTAAALQTAASLGHFVSDAGATGQMAAPIGRYVGVTAAVSATIAPIGTYVSVTGASAPTQASLGHYVNTVGASAQIAATPGYFVSTNGASLQSAAQEGYFVSTAAATTQTFSDFSYIAGQLASTDQPLLNDGASGSSRPTLDLTGKTIVIRKNLTSARGLTVDTTNIDVAPDQTANLSGLIAGQGPLLKQGLGSLNLSGNINITGNLIVNQGTLHLDANFSNQAIVNYGGVLQGSGQINTIINRGTVSIGGNSGSLRVIGDYTSEANSTLRVNATPTNIPVLQIGGQANLNGNISYNLSSNSGNYLTGYRYTILEATGGVLGNLNNQPISTAGYTITNHFDANSVSFELTYRDLEASATTPNNFRIGSMLDEVKVTASGDLSTVINGISSLSSEDADRVFGRLTANQILGYAWSEQQKYDLINRTVANRLSSYGAENQLRGMKNEEINSWVKLQAFGARNSSPYLPSNQSINGNGITVGADYKTNHQIGYEIWGGSLSAINSNIGAQDGGNFAGTTYILQGYGKQQINDYSIDYMLAYGIGDAKQSRQINLISSTRTAKSNVDNTGLDLSTRLSKNISSASTTEIRPYIGFGYRMINISNYKEVGAQSLDLSVDSMKVDAKTYEAGIKYSHSFDWRGYTFKPSADISARRQALSNNLQIKQSFTDGSGAVTLPSNLGSYTYPSVALALEALSSKNLSANIVFRSDKQSNFWIWGTQLGINYRW
jgi:autotransporter-associated beta strand protein